MRHSLPLALLALLFGAGCSALLDFDDQCAVDADCAGLGRGLRCDEGVCVPRPLVDQAAGCDRLFGEDPRNAPPGSVITLGTLLPFSGALASYGPGMDNAVRMAINEINQAGGIQGVKLAVLGCDSGTDPNQAERAARHLVDVADVPAIIGAGGSTVTIETFNRVARSAGVLMMSPSSTSPAISTLPDDGLLWRTAPSDAVQGNAIAAYLRDRGFARIVIVNRDDAYGNGLASVIETRFCDDVPGTCIGDSFIRRLYPGPDLSLAQEEAQAAIVTQLESLEPDAVVLIGYVDDGLFFLNLAQDAGLGARMPFILADGMRNTALVDGVSDDLGEVLVPGLVDPALTCALVGTNPASPSGELFQSFFRRFDANFGTGPTTFAAHAYDAAYVIALGLAAAAGAGAPSPRGRQLAEGIARLTRGTEVIVGTTTPGTFGVGVEILRQSGVSTVDVRGVSGALDFDIELGEPSSGIEMWRFNLDTDEIVNLGVVFDGKDSYDFSSVTGSDGGTLCRSTD